MRHAQSPDRHAGGRAAAFAAIRPEHVEPALQATLAANRAELARLLERSRSGAPTFERDVLPLEELGDRLHRVWSPVSHLHAVANTPELREAYNRCLPHLSRYHTEIGQNAELFRLFETGIGDHHRGTARTAPGRCSTRHCATSAWPAWRLPDDKKQPLHGSHGRR